MKKFIPAACLILITLLFNGCTSEIKDNDENKALMTQILGKWQLTGSYSGDQSVVTPVSNGYIIAFNIDDTFTSNEENGYNGGSYKILNTLGNNLRLIYSKSWSGKQVYKYINNVDAQHIYIEASTPSPTTAGQTFVAGYVLTRVP